MKNILLVIYILLPLMTFADTQIQVSGWIPYWRKTAGTAEAINHINTFDTLSPFEFNVKKDGTLVDTAKTSKEPWLTLYQQADKNNVEIIPTILWGDRDPMHNVLTSITQTKKHIRDIRKNILQNPLFDGVDIDYEGKSADTRGGFSQFLKMLKKETVAAKKILVCTIEPRTPLQDRMERVTQEMINSLEYANDYEVIARVCDRVRIMTYDQGAIDIKLNAVKKSNAFYAPVADKEWVEKVIQLAIKTIPREKIELGIATYGYLYELTPRQPTGYEYRRLRALNYPAALELAQKYDKTLDRNAAGEVSFSYPVPDPVTGLAVEGGPIQLVWLSDAVAVREKIQIAQKYNLRGVSLFKIDGEHQADFWEVAFGK